MQIFSSEQVGIRLKRRMEELRKAGDDRATQDAIADRCNLAQSTVSRYLRAQVPAAVSDIPRMALALGLTPNALLMVEADVEVPANVPAKCDNAVREIVREIVAMLAELHETAMTEGCPTSPILILRDHVKSIRDTVRDRKSGSASQPEPTVLLR